MICLDLKIAFMESQIPDAVNVVKFRTLIFLFSSKMLVFHGWIQRGGQGVRTPPPLKNHKNIGFLSNTGPDPLKHHKAANGASLAGQ